MPLHPTHRSDCLIHPAIALGFLLAFALVAVVPNGARSQTCPGCTGLCARGVCFPGGAASFADSVIAYRPPSDCLPSTRTDTLSLWVPDERYVSLGQGGLLELAFTDNALTNSGNASNDLYVFEVGSNVESCFIALRPADETTRQLLLGSRLVDRNGDGFFEGPQIGGGTAGVDVDAFVTGAGAGNLRFDAVQIIDDASDGTPCRDTDTPGADIDAVGAISAVPPECPRNNVAPSFVPPTPCEQVLDVRAGGAITLTIAASDQNEGDLVRLERLTSLPDGATLTPRLPASGNPVSTEFKWTPSPSDVGLPVFLAFAARDRCNSIVTCVMQVRVLACTPDNVGPAFVAPTPACGSVLEVAADSRIEFTVASSDPNTGDAVALTAIGVPAGATLTPQLPATANPVSTVFSWVPARSDVGDHDMTFAGRDPCGVETRCTVTVRVLGCPLVGCTIAGRSEVCSGEVGLVYTSAVTPAGGAVTYAWSIIGNGSIVGPTTDASVTVNAGGQGAFTLSLDATRDGCASSCAQTMAVSPTPTATIDGPDAVIANATGITYNAGLNPAGGPVTYAWAITGNGTIIGSTTGESVTVNAGAPGKFELTLDAASNGCSATSPVTKSVVVTPDCAIDVSHATAEPAVLWPPNHRYVPIDIVGVIEERGGPVAITVTGVTEDGPLHTEGDGHDCPDAVITDGVVRVRATRSGSERNGRVYTISFQAAAGSCNAAGTVKVCVPHDRGGACIEDGRTASALACESSPRVEERPAGIGLAVSFPSEASALFQYSLPVEAEVALALYDIAGRRVLEIEGGRQTAGVHRVSAAVRDLQRGVYYCRLRAGSRSVSRTVVWHR